MDLWSTSSGSFVNVSTPEIWLPAPLLHVLMLPDFERADRIGEFWGNPKNARREQDSVVRQRARMYLEDVRIAGQHATCLN